MFSLTRRLTEISLLDSESKFVFSMILSCRRLLVRTNYAFGILIIPTSTWDFVLQCARKAAQKTHRCLARRLEEVDVWCVGVVVYAMLCGRVPRGWLCSWLSVDLRTDAAAVFKNRHFRQDRPNRPHTILCTPLNPSSYFDKRHFVDIDPIGPMQWNLLFQIFFNIAPQTRPKVKIKSTTRPRTGM